MQGIMYACSFDGYNDAVEKVKTTLDDIEFENDMFENRSNVVIRDNASAVIAEAKLATNDEVVEFLENNPMKFPIGDIVVTFFTSDNYMHLCVYNDEGLLYTIEID